MCSSQRASPRNCFRLKGCVACGIAVFAKANSPKARGIAVFSRAWWPAENLASAWPAANSASASARVALRKDSQRAHGWPADNHASACGKSRIDRSFAFCRSARLSLGANALQATTIARSQCSTGKDLRDRRDQCAGSDLAQEPAEERSGAALRLLLAIALAPPGVSPPLRPSDCNYGRVAFPRGPCIAPVTRTERIVGRPRSKNVGAAQEPNGRARRVLRK